MLKQIRRVKLNEIFVIAFHPTLQEYADSLQIPYLETSAKDDYNIDTTFMTLTHELIAR